MCGWVAERQRSFGHGGRKIEEEEGEEEGRQGEGVSGLQAYGANRTQTVIGEWSEGGQGNGILWRSHFLNIVRVLGSSS